MLTAETSLSWASALSVQAWVALVVACAAIWFALRTFWGRSLVRGRLGLLALRMIAMSLIVIILLGPNLVDEEEGEVKRPSMMVLFDGSQSMELGGETNRWEQALAFADQAYQDAGERHSGDVQSFRFGHRLSPLASDSLPSETNSEQAKNGGDFVKPPTASDSRLADALRQLLPQVSHDSSAGVVLLSDGRVRASESVERLAGIFGQAKVPIHVVPVGNVTGTGDIAIVSLVVPSRVRKYTESELQVFLRSFGYAGKETTVRLQRKAASENNLSETLATLPLTLSGGAQSATLKFRVDARPEDLVVTVDSIEDELTTRNNTVSTRVEIDRTKVRVLNIEGNQSSAARSLLSQFLPVAPSSSRKTGISVQSALQADEDVECTTLISQGNGAMRKVLPNGGLESSGFPGTRAALFAYDCVIFNDVSPGVLRNEHQAWLAQWIDGRGGGLIIAGSAALQPNQWTDSPLTPLLPAVLSGSPSQSESKSISTTNAKHAIWRLRIEQGMNQQLLADLPDLIVPSTTGVVAKPSATVLAKTTQTATPVILANRSGRGRVLVSTASLSGMALEQLAEQWGPQPERVAAKLWRNMVYWTTEESFTGRRRLIVESDKRFYRPGQKLSISAFAYNEAAKRTAQYRVWAMFEPESLEDMSLYSPVLWPEGVIRESGEVSPRIAWGEELPLRANPETIGYDLQLLLSETSGAGDSGMRIEMTAYEGAETNASYSHGTQVDSTSLAIQILSDPFEQQNPLPNHELLRRVAAVSGGQEITETKQLAALLQNRHAFVGPPSIQKTPAWNRWWLWLGLIGVLSGEWVWRRLAGLA